MTYWIDRAIAALPLSISYRLARVLAWLTERVFKYRVTTVDQNLRRSFPDQSEAWYASTRHRFYQQFADVTVEAIYAWRMPSETIGWVLLFVMGGAAWLGHNMFSRAHIYACASTLMPFSYSFIIFMALSSTIFFATRPDIWVYVGAALVAGSGLIIWWREKQNNPQDT